MKIHRLLTASLLMASCAVFAQKKTEMLLWDENPLEMTEAKAEAIHDRDFNHNPAITVYTPKEPTGKTIVMCPGGAYIFEADGHEGHDMAEWFNSMGITYAVLKYRLPQGDYTLPLADAEQAMRLVRRHADVFGVDPAAVGIMGASAGGHLASTLATHYSSAETRPDFQVLFYPVVSMAEEITHKGSRTNLLGDSPSDELIAKFSNEQQVDSRTPKAFIMLSSDDDVVVPANSLNYFKALLDNGVGATMHVYPTGGHGWGFRDSFIYKPQWTADLEKWLREEVKSK